MGRDGGRDLSGDDVAVFPADLRIKGVARSAGRSRMAQALRATISILLLVIASPTVASSQSVGQRLGPRRGPVCFSKEGVTRRELGDESGRGQSRQ